MDLKFNKVRSNVCYVTLIVMYSHQLAIAAQQVVQVEEQTAHHIKDRFLNLHLLTNHTDNTSEQETACMTTCVDAFKHETRQCCVHLDCASLPVKDLLNHIGLCPSDGMWLKWGEWSECSNTACSGTRIRHRDCYFAPHLYQGEFCQGPGHLHEQCGPQTC